MYKVNADEARIYISTVINDKPLIIFFSKLFYFKQTYLHIYSVIKRLVKESTIVANLVCLGLIASLGIEQMGPSRSVRFFGRIRTIG